MPWAHPSLGPGLRRHLGAFVTLSAIVFLVGATLGVERAVVPLLGRDVYHVGAAVGLSFIVSFGVSKAVINLGAGRWSDRIGRRPVLILGWLVALPMVALALFIHHWWAVVVANIFLGANQGLAWTMTVTAQLDLVAAHERGLAMGINEGMGYLGVAVATVAAGLVARGDIATRPFELAALAVLAGLALTMFGVPETHSVKALSAPTRAQKPPIPPHPPLSQIWLDTTWRNPVLAAITLGGLTNKLADTVAWGLLPLYFAQRGLPLPSIAAISGVYAGTWGIGQFATGYLSDRVGRRGPIVSGFVLLGGGLIAMTEISGIGWWTAMAGLMGGGMALLYPNLNAAVADMAPPHARGAVLGVYRLWRDGGYALGGILLGILATGRGASTSIIVVGALALFTGVLLFRRLSAREKAVEAMANHGTL